MNIFVVGINHKTAPIDIREKFYLTSTEESLLLSELRSDPVIIEGFVVSTCNRTEVYLNALSGFKPMELVIRLISTIKGIKPNSKFVKYFYTYSNREAVTHLFHVAYGIDSLVLGEKEILGQLKSAIKLAQEKIAFNKVFNVLTNMAIRTGKKARAETNIGFGGSSVSWAAIAMAEDVLGSLKNKKALIIGSGKMGELAVEQIKRRGIKELFLMNRTKEMVEPLAHQFGGKVVPFCDIKEVLSEVDVCICSTGAPHYILEKSTVQKITSVSHRPLLFIDISVPRNIDPQVATIANVSLFSVDDLEDVVSQNMTKRQQAIEQVEKMVHEKSDQFYQKMSKLETDVEQSDLILG